jgi:anti-sigma regulatory factor (Ser/Thr protein kinase)
VADTVLVHEQAPTRIRDQVRLIVSELATNTIRHTDSGRDGEFTVRVATAPGWARVEVIDQGGETIPTARPRPVALAESGHGLWLVQALTHTWGTLDHGARGAVFAEWIWDPEAGRDDGAH